MKQGLPKNRQLLALTGTWHNPHWGGCRLLWSRQNVFIFFGCKLSQAVFMLGMFSTHIAVLEGHFSEASHQQPAQVGLQDAWPELLRFWHHGVPHSSYILAVVFPPSFLPVVTFTNFLEILEPKEVKSVFSFLCKAIFKDVRVGVPHNLLFISFLLI